MKTQYEYISFVEIEEKPKTKVWGCVNNNSGHGADFMACLMEERKKG